MEEYEFERILLGKAGANRLDPNTAVGHTIRNHMHFEYPAPLQVYFNRNLKLLVLDKDNRPYGGKCEIEHWIGSPATDAYDNIKRQTKATPKKVKLPPKQVKLMAKIIIEGVHLSMAEHGILIDKKQDFD